MMEIYLTKMILNPRCPQVRRDLGNPQELHRTISKGFPEIENQEHLPKHLRETPRNKFDVLHRLEIDKNRGRAVLLVQSTVKPDWTSLPGDYAAEIKQKSVHEQYGRIENGMALMFRLQANPSKRDKSKFDAEKPKQRKRFALFRDEERINWLKQQGERTGFRLANIKVSPARTIENAASVEEGNLIFRKEKASPKITIGSVVFEGILQITDIEKFREALQKGIGSGKAYGFGLLSVAPVKED